MDRIEKSIILMTILAQILIAAIAICFAGCQTPYTDYGFSPGDLDRLAGANDCITDGFDWICRGPVEYITVEKIRTVKEIHTVEVEKVHIVEVEKVRIETADPIEIEIVIREIYLVKIEPDMVIETPVGIIETDTQGNIVAPPEDVDIVPYEPPPPQTEEKEEVLPKPIPKNDETEEVVSNPQPQNEDRVETEPKPIPKNDETEEVVPKPIPQPSTPQRGNILAYLHQNPQGFWMVGFIHTDYVLLEGNQLTFLGADKVRDADDSTITIREHRYTTEADDPHTVADALFATLAV